MSDHRELLQRAGHTLFGSNWQSELARALDISDRTMRRWIADPYVISPGVWNDIHAMLAQRAIDIRELSSEIARARAGTPT